MQVSDVMSRRLVRCGLDDSVTAMARQMIESGISGMPVVGDDGAIVGMISEGDLLHRREIGTESRHSWWLELFSTQEDKAEQFLKERGGRARDIMTRELVTIEPSAPLRRAAELLEKHRIKRLPVVADGHLVGIVSRADLIRAIAVRPIEAPQSTEDAQLRDSFFAEMTGAGLADANQINAIVDDGAIHLWGLVDSDAQRQAIAELARQLSGSRSVHSHLALRPKVMSAD